MDDSVDGVLSVVCVFEKVLYLVVGFLLQLEHLGVDDQQHSVDGEDQIESADDDHDDGAEFRL